MNFLISQLVLERLMVLKIIDVTIKNICFIIKQDL